MSTPNAPTPPSSSGGYQSPQQPAYAAPDAQQQTAGYPVSEEAYSSEPYQAPYQEPYQFAPPVASQPTTLAYTNTYALLAIVFAFIAPLAGIIFGHLALGQIKRNGDAGRGLGLTGLIISYAYFVFIALFFIFYFIIIISLFGAMGAEFSELSDPYNY